MESRNVTFTLSSDLDIPFRVRICSLEGRKPLITESDKITHASKLKKLSNFLPASDLFASVVVTLNNEPLTIPVTTSYVAFKSTRKWNEWLTLPIKINQIPIHSKLEITFWEYDGNENCVFGTSSTDIFNDEDCTLKRGRQKLRVATERSTTVDSNDIETETGTETPQSQNDNIEELIKRYEDGEITSSVWLNNLTFRKIEQLGKSKLSKSSQFTLFIDLIQFDTPVVFSEYIYPAPNISKYQPLSQLQAGNTTQGNQYLESKVSTGPGSLIKIFDPEQYFNDCIEQKYRKLERSHKDGNFDRELKPTARIRDELIHILNYSSVQELTQYEKNLIWRFRYFLVNNKKGLNKLLKSINFNDELETKEALKLLNRWVDIDIDDSLELLGPKFKNITVRTYAVDRLRKASDEEIELYLLQLVQALSYDELELASSPTSTNRNISDNEYSIVDLNTRGAVPTLSPLSSFLIERAKSNENLGSYLYWYLYTEAKDNPTSIYSKILDHYTKNNITSKLKKEIEFVDILVQLCTKVKQSKETTPKKIELLRHLLETKLKSFPQVSLPLDPNIKVVGTIPSDSFVFKSSLSPLKITFKSASGESYPLMFKVGDDLRQDQLVIQIIQLMNQLLLNENVDLKLTPYKIIATGPTEGAIQFVPNSTLAKVLAEYHGILPFLQHHYPDQGQELGVKDWVMDNFVRSCAGYCVITYILGVGDRHLDNLLICPNGVFFHADFGYIFGQDPKPFPPLMKLPPQIIDAFGGASSVNYNKFRNYCFVAYTILRKNSNLILNLFELMKNSTIPDIARDPEGSVLKVKEKFCLDMSEEEAILHFQNLINDSVSALLPMVIDRLHSLAQYWRA
ncbi:hypothetical protein WICPIJ_008205 [Wickerhamomyces pijperi]|uniref:Phosphatidylinositol 3-kinase VPS34 n=1 Tax=Wickerhamomyces pijperi TaxID=599730 RepID=A0A9P8TJ60_WICPI|nr:hypothetical protein WICPIJ_008205 [Wickerhamomyces pijperi]